MIKPEKLSQENVRELRQMLAQPTYLECFMTKTPMVNLRRNHKTQVLFVTLFIVLVCSQIFIIVPSKCYTLTLPFVQTKKESFSHM